MYCSQVHRNGLTLIEVVASIALLSFVLVASLVGVQRHDRQLRMAKTKALATAGADQLLSSWRDQGRFPAAQRGAFSRDGHEFTWQTSVARVEALPLTKLRLAVRLRGGPQELVAVEMLLPPQPEVQP